MSADSAGVGVSTSPVGPVIGVHAATKSPRASSHQPARSRAAMSRRARMPGSTEQAARAVPARNHGRYAGSHSAANGWSNQVRAPAAKTTPPIERTSETTSTRRTSRRERGVSSRTTSGRAR
ncbi:hypothetical protein GCM10010197_35640 [Nocardioides luteus]|uniref:Uncharacterized protein n=1 Tax=Nocardioides luteus TaxID=1844 RepID=A0ABQ5SSP9_9ACTN|nr:hypothetical protein GCM10010197_35640 [Nocardioides luteus]GLJ67025.1 hypothetical protein GCM10017579_10610 [Nocardioides luteus]